MDREFSKNAPYKQKIIFQLARSDEMEQKKFFLLVWWNGGTLHNLKSALQLWYFLFLCSIFAFSSIQFDKSEEMKKGTGTV